MNIHLLTASPAPVLGAALAEFETRFTYPLGPGRTFRISHGEDYPRFFRAIGDAKCFIAEKESRVVGVLGAAIRPLLLPDGTERNVAYIGDLKVDPGVRGTLVFLRLAQAALQWGRPQVNAAYGIVMDGTRASPTSYTGRAGIPSFLQVGKLLVLRFTAGPGPTGEDLWRASIDEGEACCRALRIGRCASVGGAPEVHSEMTPRWLVHPGGAACGRLEDTRLAKRLIGSDGKEMCSAHLACFAWKTPAAAADLIRRAIALAASHGFPALFVSIAEEDLPLLEPALAGMAKIIAPATIFAAGLPGGMAWNINTSEI